MTQPKIRKEDIKLFEKLYAEKHNRQPSKDAEGKYSCVMMQTAFEFWCIAWASQQAKIDELMLEYCQGEMSPEQLEIYARSQKVSPDTNVIDKLLASKNFTVEFSEKQTLGVLLVKPNLPSVLTTGTPDFNATQPKKDVGDLKITFHEVDKHLKSPIQWASEWLTIMHPPEMQAINLEESSDLSPDNITPGESEILTTDPTLQHLPMYISSPKKGPPDHSSGR